MEILRRTPAEWARELAGHGSMDNVLRAVRAYYRGETETPWTLPGLGVALAAELERRGVGGPLPSVLAETASADGSTKLLVATPSGAVESVLIPDVRREESKANMRRATSGAPPRTGKPRPRRAAGCISTQVGCAVGCRFCASGLLGLARNLSAAEMVAQVLHLRRRAAARGFLLTTLVFMGMGEPLHNTDELLRALDALTDRWGAGYGPATITVSTIGVLAGIERLAERGARAPNLALSLHAPDDDTRARIIPMKGLAAAKDALDAARRFAERTRRFVTVSYVLLDGVNDGIEQADALGALLEGTRFHVNLIPWNAVAGLEHRGAPSGRPGFSPSPRERAQAFWGRLRERGVPVHFRKARGAESDAACGQLRRREALA